MRKSVERMVNVLNRSVQDCMAALLRKHGNESDAMEWLADNEGSDLDELAPTPVRTGPKGVARSLAGSSSQPSQIMPPRSNARADVKVQAKTIAERYAEKAKKQQQQPVAPKPSTPAIEIADDEDEEDEGAEGGAGCGRRRGWEWGRGRGGGRAAAATEEDDMRADTVYHVPLLSS